MESTDSSTCSQHPNLPPGFRFHPTDEELVVHYLRKKAASAPLPLAIIAEVDLYKFDPWELPSKATFGEHEWYFFTPRDRKYPNGVRPNRAATSGYWKATGTDKPIFSSTGGQKVGVKKALVFYGGKPPKGIKTNWIMHEYRLVDHNSSFKSPIINPTNKKASLRLDEWVLCRIYKKNMGRPVERDHREDYYMGNTTVISKGANSGGFLLENDQERFFETMNANGDGSSSLTSGTISSSMISNPGKRSFPTTTTSTTHYWSLDSHGKRFHNSDDESHGMMEGDGSFISLLNPGVQQAGVMAFHPNTGLGDHSASLPYQLSSVNWHI